MRSTTLFFFLLVLPMVSFAADHSGHDHQLNEECDVSAVTPAIEELSSDVSAAAEILKPLKPSTSFCKKLWNCSKHEYVGYDEEDLEGLTAQEKAEYKKEMQEEMKEEGEYFLEECKEPDIEPSAHTCGLSSDDRTAIYYYTGDGYSPVNQVLWKTKKYDCGPVISSINKALAKLPAYRGFVARGTTLPENLLPDYEVGKVVNFKAYTSTSTDISTARGFAGNVLFLMYSETGKPISSFSSFGDSESEVLFAPGSKFVVISNTMKDSTRHVLMRQVTGNESASQTSERNKTVVDAVAAFPDTPASQGSDNWVCNADSKVNATIPQTILPALGKETRDLFLNK